MIDDTITLRGHSVNESTPRPREHLDDYKAAPTSYNNTSLGHHDLAAVKVTCT